MAENLAAAGTKATFEAAIPYTVAILTMVRQCPTFVGSGVFVECEGQVYLISASHVIDELKNGAYVAQRGFTALPSIGMRTTSRRNDNFDLAYWKADPEIAIEIGASILPESKILLSGFTDPFVCFSGYPYSKNKPGKAVRVNAKQINSYCFLYAGVLGNINFGEYDKTPEFHIAVYYAGGRNEKGAKATPPSPRGMSGGPMWFAKDASSASDLFLAGIFIEYYEKRGRMAFATKIAPIIQRIRETR